VHCNAITIEVSTSVCDNFLDFVSHGQLRTGTGGRFSSTTGSRGHRPIETDFVEHAFSLIAMATAN
jgi:hypothetical protein